MARETKKKGYEGFKQAGDSVADREARLKRAQKNASDSVEKTNAIFAIEDEAFKKACELASVPATARQASKFRNKYGAAARAAGISARKSP